jgi:hypothetical protein
MNPAKHIGIWMDHSVAHLMVPLNNGVLATTIHAKSVGQRKENSLPKSGYLVYRPTKHEQAGYYMEISTAIKDYNEIFLFGPANAKNELFNLLKNDHHFENALIEVKHADKMTDNQRHAFVRVHFQTAKQSG